MLMKEGEREKNQNKSRRKLNRKKNKKATTIYEIKTAIKNIERINYLKKKQIERKKSRE